MSALQRIPPVTAAPIRLGIALMTKKPKNLHTWLEYHRQCCGVERFFLRVEDTPELRELLNSPPYDGLVEASYHSGGIRDFFGQADRQARHVTSILPSCIHGIQFFSIAWRALYWRTRAGPLVARSTSDAAPSAADPNVR